MYFRNFLFLVAQLKNHWDTWLIEFFFLVNWNEVDSVYYVLLLFYLFFFFVVDFVQIANGILFNLFCSTLFSLNYPKKDKRWSPFLFRLQIIFLFFFFTFLFLGYFRCTWSSEGNSTVNLKILKQKKKKTFIEN